jgi:hypothetical protein
MKDLLEGLIISSVIDDSRSRLTLPPDPIGEIFKTDPAQPSA